MWCLTSSYHNHNDDNVAQQVERCNSGARAFSLWMFHKEVDVGSYQWEEEGQVAEGDDNWFPDIQLVCEVAAQQNSSHQHKGQDKEADHPQSKQHGCSYYCIHLQNQLFVKHFMTIQ